MAELFDFYAQGKLKPWISATYPLGQFAQAFAAIRAREAVGRLVLKVR